MDIEIEVDSEFISTKHTYPDITINLTVFNSRIVSGKPTLLEHNDLKWITKNEISKYNFCPADVVILEKIICINIDNIKEKVLTMIILS